MRLLRCRSNSPIDIERRGLERALAGGDRPNAKPGAQTRAFLAGVSGRSLSGTTEPVLVNGQGQLGTAAGASKLVQATVGDRAVEHLRAHVRRQDREIATMKREIARLSQR